MADDTKTEAPPIVTRADHLAWCKVRAFEYLDAGNMRDAVASMMSDMAKHPETREYPVVLDGLALRLLIDADVDGVRRWIVGFR